MSAVLEESPIDQTKIGLYNKFIVSRTDGSSLPGGKHEHDEYFVLNLTTDKHAIPSLAAYARSCAAEYPFLANDLRAKLSSLRKNEFVTVPEITLPNGTVVPSFQVGKYISGNEEGQLLISQEAKPWVEINFHDAKAEAEKVGLKLITELQYMAIAHDIANQDINWSGGKVGEGSIYQGLHRGMVDEAQAGSYVSSDATERRWHQLSNGEQVFDFAGNCYSWVFDDVQGDTNGLVASTISTESPSLATAPFKSYEKGMGWRPSNSVNWSGYALVRGGFWYSDDYAGVFRLDDGDPRCGYDNVGFRCTK